MSDFCEAEIQALESVFVNSFVYLCNFHREQAWERWVRDKHHDLNEYEADILLDHLRACAWALSDELGRDHNHQKCVEVLKSININYYGRETNTFMIGLKAHGYHHAR